MYCKNCGNELESNAKFCSKCGQKIESVVNEEPVVVCVNENPSKEERGPWKNFAKIGNVFGIITFVFCFFPILNFVSLCLGQFGIVFSALGKKSTNHRGKANVGLVFSIIGFALGIILYYIYLIVLELSLYDY